MKCNARRMLLGVALLANAGCLSPVGAGLQSIPHLAGSEAASKDNKLLPNKDSADICVALGADLEKGGFLADAVVQYDKARQLDPKMKHLGRHMAVLYDKIGEERKAITEFDEAVKRTPKDADLLNDFGYCHYNRGRWAEAESFFRKALAQNDKHARANVNLGLALAQQGKYDEGERAFLKATRPAEAKANVAFVLAAHGKRDEAKKLYREALAQEPGLAAARQALASLESGRSPAAKPTPVAGAPAAESENGSAALAATDP